MDKLSTPTDNREIKRADQLKPGDWIRPGYLIGGVAVAKILFVQPYDGRFRAKVLIVAWGQGDVFPEGEHFDADEMVALALPGEIPEDPNASGRDISEPDEAVPVPDGVWGEHEGGPAGRSVDGA